MEIIKDYVQALPVTRFVGIKYGDKDRVNGTFGHQWGEWFEKNRFEKLEGLLTEEFNKTYEDSQAYVGLMRWKDGEPFQYWIGMFLPQNTQIPEGFDSVDMRSGNLGVCWLQGIEEQLYCNEDKCAKRLEEKGHEIMADEEGAWWFFERYVCPRFTEKNEEGKVILDICHYIK